MFVFLVDVYLISLYVFLLFTFFSENAEEFKSAKPKILINPCFRVLKNSIVQCPVNSKMKRQINFYFNVLLNPITVNCRIIFDAF